jgi:hypothetical protein
LYPTEFVGSTQNPKKIIGTPNQQIRTKPFLKKSMYSTLKGTKNSYGGYPTEFAGSTQNPEKIIETSNQPIRTKILPKKVLKKKERSQQFVWGYPTEEPKKTIGLKLSSKNRNLKRRSV